MGFRKLVSALSLALALNVSVQAAQVQTLDRIAAIVNDEVITQLELKQRFDDTIAQLREQGTQIPPAQTLSNQILERMIMERLQLEMAKRAGIRVDQTTLNRAISGMAAQQGMSASAFRSQVEASGKNFEQFRDELRSQITIQRLQQRAVVRKIQISDQEVENFLFNLEKQGKLETTYRIFHILKSVPNGATPKQLKAAKAEAEGLHKQLLQGANFNDLAVAHSDGRRALEGGDLGWRKAGEIPAQFADVVFQMQKGQLSEVIRSPAGFHIAYLADVQGEQKRMVEQTHARHILIKPNVMLTSGQARNRLEQIRTRILGGESFANMARAHSDDKGSAAEGGDLGWAEPGIMVPEFEAEMARLNIGELSQPIRTQYGWHIIEVLERRSHDDTEEFKRAKARELLKQRKINEDTSNWLRQLRDEAYVEVRR